MLKIAICDDNQYICGELEKILKEITNPIEENLEISIFYTGEKLLKFLYEGNYFDLIFLDIQLNKKSGVEVGSIIRKDMNDETTQIVYISGDESYAMELFDVRPLNFLIKPLKISKIEAVTNEALRLIKKDNNYFEFSNRNIKHKRLVKDILYFESNKRKVKIVLKKETYEFYGTISEIKKELCNERFVVIHNSYLINSMYIVEYNYRELKMANKKILPISQSHRKIVRDKLLQHKGKGINNDFE